MSHSLPISLHSHPGHQATPSLTVANRRGSPKVAGVQRDLLLAHAMMRHVDAGHGEEMKQLRPRWIPGEASQHRVRDYKSQPKID